VAGRSSLRVGDAGGLTQFGANIVTLAPGAASSLRHWHLREDEFAIVLAGELMLVEDAGETPMRPGDCACFPAGNPDGHCFVNRSGSDGSFLVVGSRADRETAHYSDIDLVAEITGEGLTFRRRDGTAYAAPGRKD
jgi:uncharacterized cupin superfamily protein